MAFTPDTDSYLWVGINPEDTMVSFIFRGTRQQARKYIQDRPALAVDGVLDLDILSKPISDYIHDQGKAYDVIEDGRPIFTIQILPDNFIAKADDVENGLNNNNNSNNSNNNSNNNPSSPKFNKKKAGSRTRKRKIVRS